MDRSDPPRRIVSLLASATEILSALGLDDRVVAISHECDYPPQATSKPRATVCRIDSRASSREIDQQVRNRLEAGQPLYEVNWPLVRKLRPELIVTQAQCDVCAVRYADVVAAVRSFPELREAQIVALNPASLEDVFRDIVRVGQTAGWRERAEQVVASLRRRVQRVRDRTQDLPESQKPRVACIEWIEPLMLAGNWTPELLELAGAAPGIVAPGHPSEYNKWGEVVEFAPDVLLVMPCGFDARRAVLEARVLRARPGWRQLPAVQTGRVFAVDANAYFNRPGPRLVESLELLAHLLHPERFPQADLAPELLCGDAFICLTGGGE